MDNQLAAGLQMFARYAYPPNERGYCGPDDHLAMLEYRTAGVSDAGLKDLAQAFHGPWPYLKLMAERTGAGDPFSYKLVEAYWVGNELVDQIGSFDFGNMVEDKFKPRVGADWSKMSEAIPTGISHHSFHVFVTYPWVGLLDSGRGEALEILDRCRIRWGRVAAIEGDRVVVDSQPLEWDGSQLRLGDPRPETVVRAVDGLTLSRPLASGDWVSMHWRWVCDVLSRTQLAHLRRLSLRQLDATNRGLLTSGVAHVIG